MRAARQGVVFGAVCLVVAAFAYWVWPTPWQYFPPPRSTKDWDFSELVAIRTNRVSGEMQALTTVAPGGWRRFAWPPRRKLSGESTREVAKLKKAHPEWRGREFFRWVDAHHPGWDRYAAYYAWTVGVGVDVDRLP